ncbi:thioredoxin-domain-containing protein [Rhizoclosmatium globosum]|uniref:Thioredoxin-domain-containing protein n=1 Tax=Rhizoclosmatium globosum TaxID=329046 RepID=A0A1Y2CQ45_9FUNG|nr:thioredoxin-domain-containing protein [Rhizoclosmatium globosum]|eukprot:ORY48954.1 thioredoxin-domain-containing protein [Rhizoclosmatium globosum]
MTVITITSVSEFNKHTGGSKLAVVDFTATWCGPCKMVAPRFDALSSKFPNCVFLKVDVDDQKDIAATHGVRAMPTFMLFKEGRKIEEVVGADINKVERLVTTHAAGSSGFPSSGGRVLGSGATAGGNKSSGVAGLGAQVRTLESPTYSPTCLQCISSICLLDS